MQNGRGWLDRRFSMVGGGFAPPPLENEKKRLSKEILTSFTYVLLMKLGGGGSIHYNAKWKGLGGHQALVHGRGGGGEGDLPPLENKKKANIGQLVQWGIDRRNIFVL